MATESPLFQSSMELLGHSISHFNNSEELDRKLVILHLANSIELILKDLVLDTDASIYKNPKETISIHNCISILNDNKIEIPFLNKIELLIDERNALQHRFGSPNELTTIFYMTIASAFFKEILNKYYGQELDEILSQFADEKDLYAYKMREPTSESELENLKKLSKVHPLGALLSATTYLESIIASFAKQVGLEDFDPRQFMGGPSHRSLMRYGIIPPKDLQIKVDEARSIRNMAAHGRKDPTKDDVAKVIAAVEEYEKFLASLDVDAIKENVQKYLQEEAKS